MHINTHVQYMYTFAYAIIKAFFSILMFLISNKVFSRKCLFFLNKKKSKSSEELKLFGN